jgi:hypothetical protein
MADILYAAQAWLAQQLGLHASRSVSYARAATSVPVTATVGRTPFRTEDPVTGRTRIVYSDRDYLILASELATDFTKPQKGDRITDTDGVYEVRPMDGEPCCRNADPYGLMLRIHTMKVSN